MNSSSSQGKHILPIIKPKISSNDDLIMSKIQVSKSWKLPAMRSYSSGRKRKSISEEPTSSNESEELLLKKQRQNRDAQRAYRDRKERKLKEMETVIDSLQEKVKYWQRLYHSKCNEMIHLENRFNQVIQNSNVPATRETDLHYLIDNFKPLKSVSLLPSVNKLTAPPNKMIRNTTPLRSMPVLPKLSQQKKHKCSSPKNNHHQKTNHSDTTTPSSCGFCDSSTSCICTELTTTTAENRSNSESIVSKDSTKSSLTVTNSTDSSVRAMVPMTIAQLTCSSDPHTCTKCSDINQTCIKPTDSDNANNTNNNIPDEIDFTNYK